MQAGPKLSHMCIIIIIIVNITIVTKALDAREGGILHHIYIFCYCK
jgi:hypothetical protein